MKSEVRLLLTDVLQGSSVSASVFISLLSSFLRPSVFYTSAIPEVTLYGSLYNNRGRGILPPVEKHLVYSTAPADWAIYIYIYIHTKYTCSLYTHTHIYIHFIFIHTHTYIYIYIYTLCICNAYIYNAYGCVCVCVHRYIYIYIYIYTIGSKYMEKCPFSPFFFYFDIFFVSMYIMSIYIYIYIYIYRRI